MTREEWLEERRKYIGASDMPAVLGVDPFRSALDVYLEKRGMAPDREQTAAMEAGLALERAVLDWYGQRHGVEIVYGGELVTAPVVGTWAACTPDGYQLVDRDRVPVQVKCTGKTTDWDERVPEHVYVQVQHEIMVLGSKSAVALALVSTWGGFDLRPYAVQRDDALIARIKAAGDDMARRILDGDPPDPDGSDAAKRAVRVMCGTADPDAEPVALDMDAVDATDRVVSIGAEIKRLDKERKALCQKIQMQLGSSTCGALPGGGVWTFKEIERAGYTVAPTKYRSLTYKKGKGR